MRIGGVGSMKRMEEADWGKRLGGNGRVGWWAGSDSQINYSHFCFFSFPSWRLGQ
jgi:hypothetical protein